MANPNQSRTNLGAPENPEHAVDPKWAQQFDRVAQGLDKLTSTLVASRVGAEPEVKSDRESWTTPEQAESYDNMVGRDFYKLDDKKQPITDGKYYRVTHVYPEFQTANAAEFRAKFVVEQFHWEKAKGEQSVRKVETSFNVYASEFSQQYRVTAPQHTEPAQSAK